MRFHILALFLIPMQISASVFYVDGPGDGNGDGQDHHDTVRDALFSIGPAGADGVADEIRVMVNQLTEPIGWAINGTPASVESLWPQHDDIVINGDGDGDGERCIVNIGTIEDVFGGGQRIAIIMANGQSVALENLTLMLTHLTTGRASDFINVGRGDENRLLRDASLTFDNVFITASLEGNIPQDPDDTESWGTAISSNGGDHDLINIVLRRDDFSIDPDSELNLTIRDTVISHHPAVPFMIAVGTLRMDVSNSRIARCGYDFKDYYDNTGHGLSIHTVHGSQINLDDVTIDHCVQEGIHLSGPDVSSEVTILSLSAGCQILNNRTGIDVGTRGRKAISMLGERSDPISISGNRDTGFRGGLMSSFLCENTVFSGNGDNSVSLSVSGMVSTPEFNHCLFAESESTDEGEWLGVPGNISISAWPGQHAVLFNDCTFHQIVSTIQGSYLVTRPTHIWCISEPYDGSYLDLRLRNCIISGSADENAFVLREGSEYTATLENCAVVLDGPHALNALHSDGKDTGYHLAGVLYLDPTYLSTDLASGEHAFDVANPAFAYAGPDGGPLTGWGDYVGPLPPPSPSGLEIH